MMRGHLFPSRRLFNMGRHIYIETYLYIFICIYMSDLIKSTTNSIAFRETCVSRVGPIEGHLKPLEHHGTVVPKELRGVLN